MYRLMCLLSGVILGFVIVINGSLTGYYGAYIATVIIHIVGTTVSYLVMKASKQAWRAEEKLPLWMYSGGLIGILTTIFQGIAFGQLGATTVMALCLFGQAATSLVVDTFGLFGMNKQTVNKGMVLGVAVSLCGVVYMLLGDGELKAFAMLLAAASGVSGVTSRLANAQLSARTSAMGSSFTNHWVGLVGSVALLLLVQPNFVAGLSVPDVPAWVYIGGAFGVLMVLLWNIAGLKVSAFELTLLSFIGQVFTGIVLDMLLGNGFSREIFIGGTFVVAGVLLNMFAGRKKTE